MATCWLDRSIPRTCTAEIANGDNFVPPDVDNPKFRKSMQELLTVILSYFEELGSEANEDEVNV